MECISLKSLVEGLECGTKLHISIVFLNDYGNEKTRLDDSQTIHKTPICDFAKSTENGYLKCFACRNKALNKAIRERCPFGGFCVNGVYEYCRPVVIGGEVACVIFVGNIFSDNERIRRFDTALIETMEGGLSFSEAERAAVVIEGYIRLIFEKYPRSERVAFDPLIENIKKYIEENLLYSFSVSDLVLLFNYNEKYIGRLFKRVEGCSIKEYTNRRRLELAASLLKERRMSVTDIAASTGFNNVTYFNRLFKSMYGVSPSEYRKSI